LAQIQSQYPDDVRLVYRHFPLMSIHENAALAAQAAEAAGAQNAFWPMHELLFEKQSDWSGLPKEQFESWLADQAAELDLDADQFAEDLTNPEIAAKIQEAWDSGQTIMPGTPFLLINGLPWPQSLPMNATNIKSIIELQRLEKRQFTSCPPMQINPAKQYLATIETEKGEIVIELFPDKAPLAVNNFVFLARNGWFDGITFHRVLPGFMAQTGDPSGTGFGGPGYAFVNESSDLMFDKAGLVAMANAGPNTNGSQFFITYGPAEQLNGGYTIFGEVISGQEVAEAITPRDPSQPQELPPGDRIVGVTVEEK
jgi:cyclophilin family peptidyl-prolyl cis-trans isomerase